MKKAVIVGINDYAPTGAGGPDLNGCVNDARDMANTLVICGFPAANIRILTNQNAKRSHILAYLKWLVNGCAAGDSLVFYYSGHGTRVANIGADLEIDGLDEAIVPHDYSTAGVIRDDEFKTVFDAHVKPGVNLEVIFDCCFSGTGTRNLNLLLEGAGVQAAVETPRYLEPLLEDEFYFSYAKEINRKGKGKEKDSEGLMTTKALVPVATLNHTLWAACRDNQVAMEGTLGGVTRGYFTFHFCNRLRAVAGVINRRLLDAQVAGALAGMGAAQINQTESKAAEFAQRIFT